jgi:hypothetical protein
MSRLVRSATKNICTWTYLVFSAGATIPLTAIDAGLSVDELYDGVALDTDSTNN